MCDKLRVDCMLYIFWYEELEYCVFKTSIRRSNWSIYDTFPALNKIQSHKYKQLLENYYGFSFQI